MVGSWAAFASLLTEDDPLLLLSAPEFDEDDPSSYLLYPPGFGPVVDWPLGGRSSPMPAGDAGDPHGSARKETGAVVDGGKVVAALDGSGAGELPGLSEAMSGKVSLAGSCGDEKDGVEYMVIGSLEINADGADDVCGGSAASTSQSGCGSRLCHSEESGSKASGCAGPEVCRSGVCLPAESGSHGDENGVMKPGSLVPNLKMDADDGDEANRMSNGSSESESDESSSSSSSSSSKEESSEEEEEDDDDSGIDNDGNNKVDCKMGRIKRVSEMEDGEIRDLDVESLAMSSDDEADGGVKGPIRSKNETEVLPPVPPIDVTLEPHHRTLSVGVISSILGKRVIVEGVEKHNPLNEGSILWITETRFPLGLVDEIFGPVKNPYYVVRFNSEEEIPAGISEGTAVSFVMEFANHILNDLTTLYKKGYDASGENDEEVAEEVEFSDDEKEAEYKKSLRQPKRETSNVKQRDYEPSGGKKVQFDKRSYQTKTSDSSNRKDVKHLSSDASAPIRRPIYSRKLQSVNWQQPFSSVTQPSNATLQQTFNQGQIKPPTWRPCVQGQVQQRGQVHAPSQPSYVKRQVQVPFLPPHSPGEVQPLAQQHSNPGQLQALQASLQQPCPFGQLPGAATEAPYAPSQPPYITGQVQVPFQPPHAPGEVQPLAQQHSNPGQLQASFLQPCPSVQHPRVATATPYALGTFPSLGLQPSVLIQQTPSGPSNASGGEFVPYVSGQACLSGPPVVPTAPCGGQVIPTFGFTQQNLLMPTPSAFWATQQLIANLSSMVQNNGIPIQQQQEHHIFHQNQPFTGFYNGTPFQQQVLQNQGASPNLMPWQGCLANPSLGQASLGHGVGVEQGALASSNGNQKGQPRNQGPPPNLMPWPGGLPTPSLGQSSLGYVTGVEQGALASSKGNQKGQPQNQGPPPNLMPWQGVLPNPSLGQASLGHLTGVEQGALASSNGNQKGQPQYQGAPPNLMPWQGGLPTPSLGQASLGHVTRVEQGALASFSNQKGHSETITTTTTTQGDIQSSMQFRVGSSPFHGRKPFGRGRRSR